MHRSTRVHLQKFPQIALQIWDTGMSKVMCEAFSQSSTEAGPLLQFGYRGRTRFRFGCGGRTPRARTQRARTHISPWKKRIPVHTVVCHICMPIFVVTIVFVFLDTFSSRMHRTLRMFQETHTHTHTHRRQRAYFSTLDSGHAFQNGIAHALIPGDISEDGTHIRPHT